MRGEIGGNLSSTIIAEVVERRKVERREIHDRRKEGITRRDREQEDKTDTMKIK